MDALTSTYTTFEELKHSPIITQLQSQCSNVMIRVEGRLSERLANSSNMHLKISEIVPNWSNTAPTPITYSFTYK